MSDISKELIQRTRDFRFPKTGYEISEEDAIEIIQNINGYFQVLTEIDQAQQARATQNNEESR